MFKASATYADILKVPESFQSLPDIPGSDVGKLLKSRLAASNCLTLLCSSNINTLDVVAVVSVGISSILTVGHVSELSQAQLLILLKHRTTALLNRLNFLHT